MIPLFYDSEVDSMILWALFMALQVTALPKKLAAQWDLFLGGRAWVQGEVLQRFSPGAR